MYVVHVGIDAPTTIPLYQSIANELICNQCYVQMESENKA